MWVCKNLSTGEYLAGMLIHHQDRSATNRIVTTTDWERSYSFKRIESAYEFCWQACEWFDLEGFEPVEE
jgi:hypothetical protein